MSNVNTAASTGRRTPFGLAALGLALVTAPLLLLAAGISDKLGHPGTGDDLSWVALATFGAAVACAFIHDRINKARGN